jgi:hypothetical protein
MGKCYKLDYRWVPAIVLDVQSQSSRQLYIKHYRMDC